MGSFQVYACPKQYMSVHSMYIHHIHHLPLPSNYKGWRMVTRKSWISENFSPISESRQRFYRVSEARFFLVWFRNRLSLGLGFSNKDLGISEKILFELGMYGVNGLLYEPISFSHITTSEDIDDDISCLQYWVNLLISKHPQEFKKTLFISELSAHENYYTHEQTLRKSQVDVPLQESQ